MYYFNRLIKCNNLTQKMYTFRKNVLKIYLNLNEKINESLMWTDHTEYEEYHKLQLCTVFRYQHNNTLYKILSKYRYQENPKTFRDIIFFQYRTPLGHIWYIHYITGSHHTSTWFLLPLLRWWHTALSLISTRWSNGSCTDLRMPGGHLSMSPFTFFTFSHLADAFIQSDLHIRKCN